MTQHARLKMVGLHRLAQQKIIAQIQLCRADVVDVAQVLFHPAEGAKGTKWHGRQGSEGGLCLPSRGAWGHRRSEATHWPPHINREGVYLNIC